MEGRWRKECPREVKVIQGGAMTTNSLFLIRETGPTAFMIQDGPDTKEQVKVLLGEVHTCSCRTYQNTRELCIHICWLLLRKFKLKLNDPRSFQKGLVPRELDNVLSASTEREKEKINDKKRVVGAKKIVQRRTLKSGDSCPICLEDFSSRSLPLTYCKYTCGNAVHSKCMMVLVDHQDVGPTGLVYCPLCRGDFGTLAQIKETLKGRRIVPRPLSPLLAHPDLECRLCLVLPIRGNAYKCLKCPQMVICAGCLSSHNFRKLHLQHGLAVKKGPEDKWRVRPAVEQGEWNGSPRDPRTSRMYALPNPLQ